jgi:tetratricopeptide (TPR) repeat protein
MNDRHTREGFFMKSVTGWILILTSWALLSCGGEGGEGSTPTPEAAGDAALTVNLPEGAQALSFMGEPLYPPEFTGEGLTRMQEELTEALTRLEEDRTDADAMIWAGRRAAYLGEYRDAIDMFTLGIRAHPEDARFYRHRGHRYITVRELDNAIADFARAAELIQGAEDEVEPDGQPNAMGIPTSTLHFNIWYHYGLAHYLKGEFDQAVDKYRRCMEVSEHPDSKVATAHWLYMSLRRLGMDAEAQTFISSLDLDALAPEVIESGSYLELLRLYASAGDPNTGEAANPQDSSAAALGYGYGNWLLYNGDAEGARAVFQNMVAARNQWPSFGYIASEAELARMGEGA